MIATQRWSFPTQSTTDSSTWFTPCNVGVREDIYHCIWPCPLSLHCWLWGESLFTATYLRQWHHLCGAPPSPCVYHPTATDTMAPDKFWQILRAVICWQIWKDRNHGHFLAAKPDNQHRIIRKSWHRLGVYLRKEWRYLVRKVHLGVTPF